MLSWSIIVLEAYLSGKIDSDSYMNIRDQLHEMDS
jgi:hypothetical protein